MGCMQYYKSISKIIGSYFPCTSGKHRRIEFSGSFALDYNILNRFSISVKYDKLIRVFLKFLK